MKMVLVIEDNRDNLRLISYALKQHHYEILAAESGEEGVSMALSCNPDLIITDINLPGIDGIETIRRIRSEPVCGSVPIIAITSFAMAGDRERILSAGCDGYFEKPINPLTIMEDIHRIVARRKA